MAGGPIAREEIHKLCERLSRNDPSLQELALFSRSIDFDGCRHIVASLRGNSIVQTVNLGCMH